MATDRVVFQGAIFYRYPDAAASSSRRYYTPGFKYRKKGVDYLHREIWKSVHGPIPEGHSIHHKDYNTLNNDPENLVCMPDGEHATHHGLLREMTEKQLLHLASIRPLAYAWQGTPEGHEFHVKNGKATFAKRKPTEEVCTRCGKSFQHMALRKAKYCSSVCASVARRDRGNDNEDRICLWCDATFRVNRFLPNKCCSRTCAQRYRRQIFEGGKIGRLSKKAET